MLPLSAAEIHRAGPVRLLDWAGAEPAVGELPSLPKASRGDYIELMVRGGYPEIRGLDTRPRNNRYHDYIDAIVERDVAVNDADLRSLRWFRTEGPGRTWKVVGIVVYLGAEPLSLGDNLFAVPLSAFWAY